LIDLLKNNDSYKKIVDFFAHLKKDVEELSIQILYG